MLGTMKYYIKFNLVEPVSVQYPPVEAPELDYRIRQLGTGEEKWRNKVLDVEVKI